jgi:hypothetical protein
VSLKTKDISFTIQFGDNDNRNVHVTDYPLASMAENVDNIEREDSSVDLDSLVIEDPLTYERLMYGDESVLEE